MLDFVEGGCVCGARKQTLGGKVLEQATEEFLETFGEFTILCLFRRDEGIFAWICLRIQVRSLKGDTVLREPVCRPPEFRRGCL